MSVHRRFLCVFAIAVLLSLGALSSVQAPIEASDSPDSIAGAAPLSLGVSPDVLGDPRLTARAGPAMAYDSQSDRVILFGGSGIGGSRNDTWAYDLGTNKWTNMTPSAMPPARYYHAMAYDSQSDRVILFGGIGVSGTGSPVGLGDTWAYDFDANTWTNMSPATTPSALAIHAMAYDSQSDRVILFGGSGIGGSRNDTWAYDFDANTWTQMNTVLKPSARYAHAIAYDSQSDRVILLGGERGFGAVLFRDTCVYDFDANTWTVKNIPARFLHAMAYDSDSSRTLLFGGYDVTVQFNDTWAYDF